MFFIYRAVFIFVIPVCYNKMKMSLGVLDKSQIGGKQSWKEKQLFCNELLIKTMEMCIWAGEDSWGNLKYERSHLFRECSF